MKKIFRLLHHGVWAALSLTFFTVIIGGLVLFYLIQDLPDVSSLRDTQYKIPLRVYTADEKLIAEYGEQRRIPITLDQVPEQQIQAILATEDRRFYTHSGVDIKGLLRAARQLLLTGDKQQGGSTITMQVARNFFLTREKTFARKFKEILLAIKIDYLLDKKTILELYFNKIYFGNRAYGIAAAAQVYYGKELSELTLPEMAMLAGLPKAPSAINPLANPRAAVERRNHVLFRMLEANYIDQERYQQVITAPLTASYHGPEIEAKAEYVGEMARQYMVERFGEEAYTAGYKVYTTVDSKLQEAANQAVQDAIISYEERHGYRGPTAHLGDSVPEDLSAWQKSLREFSRVGSLQPAAVIAMEPKAATVLLRNGEKIKLDWDNLKWARPYLDGKYMGPHPDKAADIFSLGDVIYVRPVEEDKWRLTQMPAVEGSLIALNPVNGAVEALVGGYDFYKSHFNRVMQSERQTGSSFKPFVYSAALASGMTWATIINDAPIVLEDPSTGQLWRPQNVTRRFYGPTRLRTGLLRSRNLVSIRTLDQMGIAYAIDYLQRFGFKSESLPPALSLALGSGTATPMEMAVGYAVIANGGYRVTPHWVARIEDSEGEVIFEANPAHACPDCFSLEEMVNYQLEQDRPLAPRVITPEVSYLMANGLRDSIQRGTGRRARSLQREDLAGKTGTTNDQLDGWFAGFLPDLVAIAWMGYDQPRSIHEYGAQSALPLWIDFMDKALEAFPEEKVLPVPPDIVVVKIDPQTGLLAKPGQDDAIFEVFRSENAPTQTHSDDMLDVYDEEAVKTWDEVF